VSGSPEALRLDGTWRALPADEALRRTFAEPELDDSGWEGVSVPGHWRSSPAFAGSDGPVLHRHRFGADRPAPGERAWLVFDGIFYQGDVWFDGAYLGDTEGYFVRHTFEVTDACRRSDEHVVAVEATCSPERDRTAKRNLTGVFQHWDCADPGWNPGGIWRPVRLERTGPVRARSLRVLCTKATADRAVVALRAELDSDAARTVRLRTTVGGTEHVAEWPVAEGSNFVDWRVSVPQPRLWWPHALGEAALTDVTVEVAADGAASHTITRRTGLRSLSWRGWTLAVNGERLFLKGANQGPNRMALAEATPDELAADVALARDTGLDLLRLHAHVNRPELYRAADEAGMLLWQDLPLQWGYARGVRRQALRQASAAVDQLGHHPSVALWCAHNEPFALDLEPGGGSPEAQRAVVARFLAGQVLPSFNRSVLDRSLRRTLERADPTRRVLAHSGVAPGAGTAPADSHLYFGWYHGDERDLPAFTRRWPRMAGFVSEFGAQAVPESDAFLEPERWPDLDWARLGRLHALQKAVFDRRVPPAAHATYASWKAATQAYQAELLTHHVEHLRRLKYRPAGGFCQFAFADGHPGVTWSVLDAERRPKPGYAALAAACRPVIVVADRLPAAAVPGATLRLDVHVVSDLRHPLADVVVEAELSWPGGTRRWEWSGEVGADAVAHVGTIEAAVPDEPGPLRLDLALRADGVAAANADGSTIVAAR
jgi:beta-mannosidase